MEPLQMAMTGLTGVIGLGGAIGLRWSAMRTMKREAAFDAVSSVVPGVIVKHTYTGTRQFSSESDPNPNEEIALEVRIQPLEGEAFVRTFKRFIPHKSRSGWDIGTQVEVRYAPDHLDQTKLLGRPGVERSAKDQPNTLIPTDIAGPVWATRAAGALQHLLPPRAGAPIVFVSTEARNGDHPMREDLVRGLATVLAGELATRSHRPTQVRTFADPKTARRWRPDVSPSGLLELTADLFNEGPLPTVVALAFSNASSLDIEAHLLLLDETKHIWSGTVFDAPTALLERIAAFEEFDLETAPDWAKRTADTSSLAVACRLAWRLTDAILVDTGRTKHSDDPELEADLRIGLSHQDPVIRTMAIRIAHLTPGLAGVARSGLAHDQGTEPLSLIASFLDIDPHAESA